MLADFTCYCFLGIKDGFSRNHTIRTQFQAGQWAQFLQMIQIDGLRGWPGQAVEFNFPVVAVVGENGSGKSTLLNAKVGDQVRKSSTSVWEILTNEWCKSCLDPNDRKFLSERLEAIANAV